MLILHTSDWHLGRSLHRADLTPAFEMWCEHVITTVRERGIDAVLISGDVYDRAIPPASTVKLFDHTLGELSRLTTVILTSGNHDSPQRLGFGAELMREGIHFRTDSRACSRPIAIRNSSGEIGALVYAIPYLDPDTERRRLAPAHAQNQAEPMEPGQYLERSHEAVLGAALERIGDDIRTGAYAGRKIARICMAHAFITGGSPTLSERDIHVGGVDSVPSGLFRLGESGPGPLDYVALGHLHSPQRVGLADDPPMRYSGSPIAFSFGEASPKSSVLLHVLGGEVRETELIPAPVWRRVSTLEGPLAELLAEKNASLRNDFVRLIVTDPARPTDMAAQLRAVFPHSLEIQHRGIRNTASTTTAESVATRSPLAVLTEFMETAGNRALTAEEAELLRDVWEEVLRTESGEVPSHATPAS